MINGIINVYKEAGFTSFDVVAKLRGIVGQKKIGHTGTLDPDAKGVLPVCLGSATKLCEYLTDKTKAYEATFRLGIETDTQDISGKILSKTKVKLVDITNNITNSGEVDIEKNKTNLSEVDITQDKIVSCIMSFAGKQQQIPPMYSAIKVDGKKLYELAREGREVERKPRDIEIFEIKIKNIIEQTVSNETCIDVTIEVECSKGTYIRTLCYDIGRKLGCGATMTKLLRTRSGNFLLKDALTLKEIEDKLTEVPLEIELQAKKDKPARMVRDTSKVQKALEDITINVDSVFSQYQEIAVDGEELRRVLNGNYVNHDYCGDLVRVYNSDRRFLAIYEYSKRDKCYKPQKMFLE